MIGLLIFLGPQVGLRPLKRGLPGVTPPRTPRYNGALESGHRHLKVQADHLARLNGRPGAWTSEDLEIARMLRNALSIPRGQGNRSAAEVWRDPVADEPNQRLAAQYIERAAAPGHYFGRSSIRPASAGGEFE